MGSVFLSVVTFLAVNVGIITVLLIKKPRPPAYALQYGNNGLPLFGEGIFHTGRR